MKVSFEMKDQRFNTAVDELAKLASMDIKFGITERTNKVRGDSTLAKQAAWNEYGTEDLHIPERPAHRTAFENHNAGYWQRINQGAADIIAGNKTAEQVVKAAAEWYLDKLRESVLYWSVPRNADATIAKKGFNDPLIETGETYDALDYEMKDNGTYLKAKREQLRTLSAMQSELNKMKQTLALSAISQELQAMRRLLK